MSKTSFTFQWIKILKNVVYPFCRALISITVLSPLRQVHVKSQSFKARNKFDLSIK